MDSALVQYLKTGFLSHYGVRWDSSKNSLRREEKSSIKFEIKDKEDTIVQYTGHGVSVLNNKLNVNVEIIDFEDFMNQFDDTPAGIEDRCDFIINPIAGYDVIVFNELTETKSRYIHPFVQPTTGEEREGKLNYAKGQLKSSIERFYICDNFLDNYGRKVALFSYKLTDTDMPNNPAMMSMKAFQSVTGIYANISSDDMPHGFTFEQRVYNKEFIFR